MNKITTHLWFDKEAKEAADFYTKAFGEAFPEQKNTKTESVHKLEGVPGGEAEIVNIQLMGEEFTLLSAGPLFKFNPSISFFVNFDPSKIKNAKERLNTLWKTLSEDGNPLMELAQYPFSEWYGWVADKYGLTWQLMLTNPAGEERPLLIPSLMFVGKSNGKTAEAIDFYLSVFKDSRKGSMHKYGPGQKENGPDNVMFADFMLENKWFAAMDGGTKHDFNFNEAISFMVQCIDQKEIDYYWEKLSAVPESEQCGWLKDKYGVSWQIVPVEMNEMMTKGTGEQISRVTQAFLPMKKFDLEALRKAYNG